ncbi:MAG: DNA-binding transcriptional regulator [Pseudomonadota bacterium]
MAQVQHTTKPQNNVRSLARGLEILRYVNMSGGATAGEIARATGLPRPTVYRALDTLEQAGYVAFAATSNIVRVTALAASLGDSHAQMSELCNAAGPIFAENSKTLIWPLVLSVYENAAMVVQETTHARSPLSIDRAMVGSRLPMLRTAAGRAYLTYCGEKQREIIVEHLRRIDDPADTAYLNPNWIAQTVDETEKQGVGVRTAGEFRTKTASVAAPIFLDDEIVGCVSIIWIRTARQRQEALNEYRKPIIDLAKEIEASLKGAHETVMREQNAQTR